MKLDAILSPQELPALAHRDLRRTTCVVFDILRATSTFVTALHHGAAAILPVSEIAEALALRQKNPAWLLAGERDGVRIRADGVDFDLGNSPREFTPERVRGRTIISTTTNGTRALRACARAQRTLAASFLNLAATEDFLRRSAPEEILLVCAGTGDSVALEDVLAAGKLANLLARGPNPDTPSTLESSDAVEVARCTNDFRRVCGLLMALECSTNGSRLYNHPELRPDVAFCAQWDIFNLVAVMDASGQLTAC